MAFGEKFYHLVLVVDDNSGKKYSRIKSFCTRSKGYEIRGLALAHLKDPKFKLKEELEEIIGKEAKYKIMVVEESTPYFSGWEELDRKTDNAVYMLSLIHI